MLTTFIIKMMIIFLSLIKLFYKIYNCTFWTKQTVNGI